MAWVSPCLQKEKQNCLKYKCLKWSSVECWRKNTNVPGVRWKVAQGAEAQGDKEALGGMGATGTSELREWWVVAFFYM